MLAPVAGGTTVRTPSPAEHTAAVYTGADVLMNFEKALSLTGRRSQTQRQLAIPLLYVGALAVALLLIADGRLTWLALIVVGVGAVAVAYRLPLVTIVGLLVLWGLPLMFTDTSWVTFVNMSVKNVPLGDLPLLPMAGAIALRAALVASRTAGQRLTKIWQVIIALASLLALIMLIAVAQGYFVYHLSAIRELTVDFLGLIVAPYVALFVRSPRSLARTYKTVTAFALVLPLLLLPVVGHLVGWSLGGKLNGTSRFYPSAADLGLLYAVVATYVFSRSNRRWRRLFHVIVVPALAFIVIDSNRSVWLVGIVIWLALIAVKRIKVQHFWRSGFVTALVLVAATAGLTVLGKDPLGSLLIRARALTNPGADPTASWRLEVWRSSIAQSRTHLLFGQGFGAAKGVGHYFNFNLANGGAVTVIPHNMYLMTLYNLGLVGLLTYVALGAVLVAALIAAWRAASRSADAREIEPILLMGLLAAIGTITYGIPYTFEEHSMLYLGLGLAAVLLLLRSQHADKVGSISGAATGDRSSSGAPPAAPTA